MKRDAVLYEKQRASAYVYSKVNSQGIPEATLQTLFTQAVHSQRKEHE